MFFTEIQVNYPITIEKVRTLLVSAFEEGSNYWMHLDSIDYPPDTTEKDYIDNGKYSIGYYNPCYVVPFHKDGAVIIQDIDNNHHALTKEKLHNGLITMSQKYPQHFYDFLTGNYDSGTADLFLQLSLFNKEMYQ